MNKLYGVVALIFISTFASAQAFRQGSLLVSVSEGSTSANYATTSQSDVLHEGHINGARDPLTVEYGITRKWGIGLNMGTDFYNLNPANFYNFQTSKNTIRSFMSEFTFDGNYHFFVLDKLDLSAFASVGFSSVNFKGNDGDRSYNYVAGGMIARTGVKVKYYFFRRLGAMAMYSLFADKCSTGGVNGNTVGEGYTTTIRGTAIEFGLCYRILR
jgi:hypothetical protein